MHNPKGTSIIKAVNTREESFKEELKREIAKKEKQLLTLSQKLESLRIELLMIKHQYDMRIGALYMKLNELELEIIRILNTIQMIEEGYSPEAAKRKVEARLNEDTERLREERANFDEMQESEAPIMDEEAAEELKKLWRKLAARYHPDLVMEESEKKHRTEIMKKINAAYRDGDLHALRKLEEEEQISFVDTESINGLQEKLTGLMNTYRQMNKEFKDLKRSEWYEWKEHIEAAKEEGRDAFAELEKKLKVQVKMKEQELKDFQSE